MATEVKQEECKKQIRYGEGVFCGYAFPSKPKCDYYPQDGELFELVHGNGERTLHTYCMKDIRKGEEQAAAFVKAASISLQRP